jgi:hypothetical protein
MLRHRLRSRGVRVVPRDRRALHDQRELLLAELRDRPQRVLRPRARAVLGGRRLLLESVRERRVPGAVAGVDEATSRRGWRASSAAAPPCRAREFAARSARMSSPGSSPRKPSDRRLGVVGVAIAGAFAAAIVAGAIGAFVAGRNIKEATDGKPLPKGSVVAVTPFSLAPSARTAASPSAASNGGATPAPAAPVKATGPKPSSGCASP